MCIITKKYNKEKFYTGYKVVYKLKGKYYSPYTGYQYHVGGLPKMTTSRNEDKFYLLRSCLSDTSPSFTEKMQERTAVLTTINEVAEMKMRIQNLSDLSYFTSPKVVILKMTIFGDLHHGRTGHTKKSSHIIVGRLIECFEEVDLFNEEERKHNPEFNVRKP